MDDLKIISGLESCWINKRKDIDVAGMEREAGKQRKAAYLPIKSESIIQLAHVECTALPDELDVTRPSCAVVKRDEHDVR